MKVSVEIDTNAPQFLAAAVTALRVCVGQEPTTSDDYTDVEHMLDILCSNLEGDLAEWTAQGVEPAIRSCIISLRRLIQSFEGVVEKSYE